MAILNVNVNLQGFYYTPPAWSLPRLEFANPVTFQPKLNLRQILGELTGALGYLEQGWGGFVGRPPLFPFPDSVNPQPVNLAAGPEGLQFQGGQLYQGPPLGPGLPATPGWLQIPGHGGNQQVSLQLPGGEPFQGPIDLNGQPLAPPGYHFQQVPDPSIDQTRGGGIEYAPGFHPPVNYLLLPDGYMATSNGHGYSMQPVQSHRA